MADIRDVIENDRELDKVLGDLQESTSDTDVYLATKAVCLAIQNLGIRIDYVLSEINRQREL